MGFFDRFGKKEDAAERQAWLETTMQRAASQTQTQYLSAMRQAQRGFEAAETPVYTESWKTHARNINEDLERQLPTLRARARAQARDDEWATRYLIQLDDNVLGDPGMRLQMRLKKRDGNPDTAANNLLENAFALWGENADVSGLCWREIESLALRGLPTDGEILYRLRPGAGPMGIQIQLLDPTLLDVTLRRDWNGNRVRMGVEVNDDGRALAYWLLMQRVGDSFSDVIQVGRHVRIPADQIRHKFLRAEVGQFRGYPWLSAGARRLWLLHDFEEAASVASSNAAKRQGFFVSPDGNAPAGFADTIVSSVLDQARAAGKVLTADEVQALTAAAEKYATTVPGQFDTLPQGYDFRPFESKWPDIDANGHVKQHLRAWAAARGVSYVTLGNDLEAVNYSSARVGILDEREHYKTVQGLLRKWLHKEIFAEVLPYLILNTPPLKMERLAIYAAAATWQPRRWNGIDPVKEATASEINLRLKLTSRRRLIMERGEDPDEIFGEIDTEESKYGAIDPATAALAADAAAAAEAEDAADAAATAADQAQKKTAQRAPLQAVRGADPAKFLA